MKNTMKWFVMAAFMMIALSVSAQQKTVKLGHIDGGKLLEAMPEMAQARKAMQTKQDEVQKEMQSLREQLQKLVMEYTQNEKTYSDIIRSSKQQEINELSQRSQKFEEIAMGELEKARVDLMEPVITKAKNAIQAVGKENGFTYIFDVSTGGVIFVAESAEDVLPLVKKKLGIQ